MNGTDKRRDKLWAIYEECYPFIAALLIVGIYRLADIKLQDSFAELLSACMSFASILIGFLGVLIALLFSLNSNAIRNYIFGDIKYKKKMYRFFRVPVVSGFLFVVLSLLLYLKKTIAQVELLKKIVTEVRMFINLAWIFFLVFFILSSYRLIKIVLQIAFSERIEKIETEEQKYDIEEYNEAKELCVMTKEVENDSWE